MDNRGRQRKQKPVNKKKSTHSKTEEISKRETEKRKPEVVVSQPETEITEEPHSTCNGIEDDDAEVAAISEAESRNITATCNTTAISHVESYTDTPTTSQGVVDNTLIEPSQPPSRAESPLGIILCFNR